MRPRPRAEDPGKRGSGKLARRVALVTGGDSGIGRAVAIAFAKEGADVAIAYLEENGDARETRSRVEAHGRRCILLRDDLGDPAFCRRAVDATVDELGGLDVLVSNGGEQHPQESVDELAHRYVFLASDDASYMTGQVLHPNGGEIVNG